MLENILSEETKRSDIPASWDATAHQSWSNKDINGALQTIIEKLNAIEGKKPEGLMVQFGYYLFLLNDYKSASDIFRTAHESYPDNNEILLNLSVCLGRSNQHKESIGFLTKFLKSDPLQFVGWDSLASSYYRINEFEKAKKAGTNALRIKDNKFGQADKSWSIPKKSISELTKGKKNVIAFSLWGNQKRYIFGALRNLLLAPDIYPDWELWFYVDESVSPGFLNTIKKLNGKVIIEEKNQSMREKLCWRFQVVNHPDVGRFLVRDADSVFSVREHNAVQEWIASDKHFHVIRDWWTHTDLILAGLWGGISGTLPDINTLLNQYSPNAVSTPNIDQWFLRDCIWRYVKQSCLTHDRCFDFDNPQRFPGKNPDTNIHIGSCEFHQRREFQESILAAWIKEGEGTGQQIKPGGPQINSPLTL